MYFERYIVYCPYQLYIKPLIYEDEHLSEFTMPKETLRKCHMCSKHITRSNIHRHINTIHPKCDDCKAHGEEYVMVMVPMLVPKSYMNKWSYSNASGAAASFPYVPNESGDVNQVSYENAVDLICKELILLIKIGCISCGAESFGLNIAKEEHDCENKLTELCQQNFNQAMANAKILCRDDAEKCSLQTYVTERMMKSTEGH